jgi:hypothetical protein
MTTDEELRELVASLARSQAKTDVQLEKTDTQLARTDAQLAKTDAQLAKTDAKLDRLAELYGNVGNNQGKVAEEFYYNSLKHHLVLNGIQFDFVEKNVTRTKKSAGVEDEFDLLLVNGQDVFIIEVKYHLHPKDVDRLLEHKLPNFKILYPEYRDYKIHLGLATFAADDFVKRMALERGITVLQRRGDLIETQAA